ncbi:MAG: hypothetical protein KF850_34410 [Labilithrix sp.]|nr:hypothetical protein [Labilithrix sp.]MBX3217174.1 hypothetical protein [Labilithrix sp.]
MTTIPLRFEPHDWDEHLEFSETAGVVEARWKPIGMSVFFPPLKVKEFERAPRREDVERHTPQLRFHGHNGFSLGRYTELFVFPSATGVLMDYERPEPLCFKMGSIEGSFGQVSPLAHFFFDRGHNDDEGDFSSFDSLRLMGVTQENAEAVGLSAILLLEKEHGLPLRPVQLGNFPWADEDEEAASPDAPENEGSKQDSGDDSAPRQVVLSCRFSEVAPLRMLFAGTAEPTPEVAFHQLYRVLEYFSILCNEEKAETMRRDDSMSTRQFLLALQQIMAKDEKGALGRLISEIADGRMLAIAKEAGLIDRPHASALTEALYAFRNSVVHAKEDRGARLFTSSIFEEPSTASAWRRVCASLAWNAIERYGNRAE